MERQAYYEAARYLIDRMIDDYFEQLTGEGHRKLARVWQYLRDQEVVAIEQKLLAEPHETVRHSGPFFGRTNFGAKFS